MILKRERDEEMNSDALVQLNNIVFSYGKRPVLSNVSLVIEKGDFLGIVGPNGSGK